MTETKTTSTLFIPLSHQEHAWKQLVASKGNVLLVGPTACGKSTLLKAYLKTLAVQDQMQVIEDFETYQRDEKFMQALGIGEMLPFRKISCTNLDNPIVNKDWTVIRVPAQIKE